MKKISASKWSKLLEKKGDAPVVTKTISGNVENQEIDIEIKTSISMGGRMAFAEGVCDSCFDELDGDYLPYAKSVSFNIHLLNYFTNIEVRDRAKHRLFDIKIHIEKRVNRNEI